MTLFAETSDTGVAGLMALAGLFSGAIVWLAKYLNDLHKRDRDEKKEDNQTIIDHMKELNARVDREAELRRAEADRALRQAEELRANQTLMVAHIRYLEGIMESKTIPFRPFDLSQLSGSSLHRPVSESNGE